MKYPFGFGLQLPFILTQENGSSQYHYGLLSTNDPVDHRHIKRIIRKWVKQYLERTLHTRELHMLLKRVVRHNQPMHYVRMPSPNAQTDD